MPYAEVGPAEVKARIARGENVFLLDVREPFEVEEWAYPIGVNIPLGELGDRLDEVLEGGRSPYDVAAEILDQVKSGATR